MGFNSGFKGLMKHMDFYFRMEQNHAPTDPIWTLHMCVKYMRVVSVEHVCLLNQIVFKLWRPGHATVDLQLWRHGTPTYWNCAIGCILLPLTACSFRFCGSWALIVPFISSPVHVYLVQFVLRCYTYLVVEWRWNYENRRSCC